VALPLHRIFDYPDTARRALGPHWNARTPEQRREFVKLFSEILDRSYRSKIRSCSGCGPRRRRSRRPARGVRGPIGELPAGLFGVLGVFRVLGALPVVPSRVLVFGLFQASLASITVAVDDQAEGRRTDDVVPVEDEPIAKDAFAGQHPRDQALAAGFRAHLAKPVDPEVLCRTVVEVMTPG
jgi:hypothetical protein